MCLLVAQEAEYPINKDYTQFTYLPHATFKGKRLGYPRNGAFDLDIPWGWVANVLPLLHTSLWLIALHSFSNDSVRSPAIKTALEEALKKMESLGATVCDQAEIPSLPEWKALATATPKFALNIIAHEFKEDIETYLATMQSTEVRNLQDIIE